MRGFDKSRLIPVSSTDAEDDRSEKGAAAGGSSRRLNERSRALHGRTRATPRAWREYNVQSAWSDTRKRSGQPRVWTTCATLGDSRWSRKRMQRLQPMIRKHLGTANYWVFARQGDSPPARGKTIHEALARFQPVLAAATCT